MTQATAPTTYTEAMVRLRERIPSMESRPQQDLAATTIETAIEDGSILVCQAGTGVGKSNAALIPAILSGKRTVYSTATKVLQTQIAEKDLPFLREHLGVEFTYAVLKGWANYVCLAKLSESAAPQRQAILDAFEADENHVGDRDSFGFEIDDMDWMSMSTSTDECPKKDCPFQPVCKAYAARYRATKAQIVVANHALVSLEAVLRSSETPFSFFGDIDLLVVDEAHELEEYLTSTLTNRLTERAIRQYAGRVVNFLNRLGVDTDTDELGISFAQAATELFGGLKPGRLLHHDVVANQDAWINAVSAYGAALKALTDQDVIDRIYDDPKARRRHHELYSQAKNKVAMLSELLVQGDGEMVRYVEETTGRNKTTTLAIVTCPVSVASFAADSLWPEFATSILISATVLVAGSSDYIASRLGLSGHRTLDAGTPFDYPRQARLFIPTHLPEPTPANKARWSSMMIETVRQLVASSGGGALLLFTSTSQMREAYTALNGRLGFPAKMQGQQSNQSLMTWFRNEHDGVLFATRSFFTGASFEGDTCRLVVIDKLPFPVPTEPVFQARCEAIKRRGGSDFNELTIPMMTLPLQQGFGRLIRTKRDTGVVAILDPRIKTKGYGKTILRSLPPALQVTSIDEVRHFFQES